MVTFCAVNCSAMVTVQNLEYKTFGIQFYIIGCIRLGSECGIASVSHIYLLSFSNLHISLQV